MKKIFAILLALALVLSMSAMAQTVDSEQGGSASITVTNASKGETYNVYKIFDATADANGHITYTGIVPTDLATYFENDEAGNITLKTGNAEDVAIKAVENYAKTLTEVATVESNGTELVFSGLEYGYYLVTSTQGALVTVTSTKPNATIVDKNYSNPVIEDNAKTINSENGDTDYQIGDTVPYKVSFKATNYDVNNKAITKYVVTDIPSGLTINQDSITVKVGETPLTIGIQYTVAFDDSGKMTITIPWAEEVKEEEKVVSYETLYKSGSIVEITYSATLVSITGSAKNKAEISYNDGMPTESEVEVTTASFTLKKTDGDVELTGAKFELYDAASEGSKINLVKEEDGVYRVATPAEEAADDFTSAVIEAGTAVIKGLDKDETYYLEEIEAPAGYNKLTARVSVDLDRLTNNTVTVVNQTGSELPSTGGIGTTPFYVLGGLMVAVAIVLLVAKKKASSK